MMSPRWDSRALGWGWRSYDQIVEEVLSMISFDALNNCLGNVIGDTVYQATSVNALLNIAIKEEVKRSSRRRSNPILLLPLCAPITV